MDEDMTDKPTPEERMYTCMVCELDGETDDPYVGTPDDVSSHLSAEHRLMKPAVAPSE